MLNLSDIQTAQRQLADYLSRTMLEPAPDLGDEVYLKLENTNRTHSFKIRGALNAILSLDEDARARGIVAASSGNHAQGVAYAAHLVNANATILMPKHTPKKKVDGVLRYGAEAVLFGNTYDETEAEALRMVAEDKLTYISPYNDQQVMAGAGTIGLEIIEQLPDVERVLVCVSGGGLIGGVARAIKSLKPSCEVIGVGAVSAPSMYNIFHDKNLPENWETLAEALSGGIEDNSITIP
ncbi:MAG: threonine/serine dehydratase, partial [Chloroflexota bacterium]